MDAELKAKWLAALRSGNYKQGTGRLRGKENKCCCLGVLCDIADPDGWRPDGPSYSHHGYTGTPTTAFLCRAQLEGHDADRLARMNDEGKPFAEIADYIATHL